VLQLQLGSLEYEDEFRFGEDGTGAGGEAEGEIGVF